MSPLILNLCTASTHCSVSLQRGDQLMHYRIEDHPHTHAERLVTRVEEVMRQAGLPMRELSAIAITSGPGSYTGLRIGMSLAKGLTYGLRIPLIAIPTLDVLFSEAYARIPGHASCTAYLNANHGNLYHAFAENSASIGKPKTVRKSTTQDMLNSQEILPHYLIGCPIPGTPDLFPAERWLHSDGPTAKWMAGPALVHYRTGEGTTTDTPQPTYL